MLAWIRSATWEAQKDAREPVPYKAKVPEFFGGVRMYRVAAGGGGAQNALEVLIKKLAFQGVLGKQDLYPLVVQGVGRYLFLKKAELDNLGVGQHDEDE